MSRSSFDQIELLDVTLRDGGFVNHHNFPQETVKHIVSHMDRLGVGRIEVGYRNGLTHPTPGLGPTGLCSKEYLTFCKQVIHRAKLCVMCLPQNIQEQDLKEMREAQVDSLRICFVPKQDLEFCLNRLKMAKDHGFEVFFNVVSVSKYQQEELISLIQKIVKTDPKAIYFADSAGHLTPDRVFDLFSMFVRNFGVEFGLHAHDNLYLAQANALAAIQAGARFIDASASGLGRGVGNLKMEGIVSLFRSQGCVRYHPAEFLELAEYVNSTVRGSRDALPSKAVIRGIFNVTPEDNFPSESPEDIRKYYALAEKMGSLMREG